MNTKTKLLNSKPIEDWDGQDTFKAMEELMQKMSPRSKVLIDDMILNKKVPTDEEAKDAILGDILPYIIAGILASIILAKKAGKQND